VRTFKLDELAAAARVSGRTVRYYVQRGLLPAPQFRGRDTAYDEEHLLRLRAIRKLQDQYLPLDAIQAELARASRGGLEKLAEGARPAPMPLPRPLPRARGETVIRWELAPGVELLASDHVAIDDTVVDEIKAIIARHGAAGGPYR
jgi:DNA-binding transcriptional MerR regulator